MSEPETRDFRTDARLFAAINRGDASAFDTLYERYADWVHALAVRFTRNEADALDVLQDAFTYLIKKAPSLQLTAKATTYLYPVVKHAAITRIRKRDREGNLSAEALHNLTAPPATAELGSNDLHDVLAGLSEPHREVVLMRYIDDMTQEEIAEALNIPVGTIKSRLHHAIKTLRADPRTHAYFDAP
ncbi:MAG: sigma-70 family RNA polymerase sigma factor [Phycisphaerales bacterium]|nr:sigma-70 family RNA polymerase sigma factor [Phycisphaerales bacterium]MCB9857106.1 sigma-70 family RNA polymerase sigma factor [Phycisphaerales bacterium]MCB9861767.1 sigma-70 family RNA polymerase sigma factor [Phycisphaerales bacterium]